MIIELPNFVSAEDVEKIRSAVTPFLPDRQDNYQTNRDGSSVNISETPELKEIDSALHGFFSKIGSGVLKCRYKPQFDSADSGYEYHRYNPGDICHHHSDGEVDPAGMLRYASVVLHLNTPSDGGEIVFPAQNKSVKTEAGKVVIFPPYGSFSHYTTPSSDAREVIVSWFVYANVRTQVV